VQAVHRIRSRLVADRVRLVNQVRGLLGEHGIVVAKDIGNLRRALARIASDDEDRTLNPLVRSLMRELREELVELDARIADYDRKIRELYRSSEICQRLGKVEGIGPVTATALVAAVGDRSSFKNGRQFAAWLGLVPKQRSSGGRARSFGISKRGDRYLRTLLIHGAPHSGGFEKSRIQEACGSARCDSGDTPTLSPSRSRTRMRESPGACSPATASMTPAFRFAQPERNPERKDQ
jgi:transposase